MVKELLQENRRKLIGAGLVLLALAFLLLLFWRVNTRLQASNDEKIMAVLSGLTYTEEAAGAEIEQLRELTEIFPASVPTQGSLYRALTEISYMTGDEMEYNRYMAYAMHYLGKAGDDASCAYLTNKYIGRLYANGCYEAAENMLCDLAEKTDISALPISQQAAYYLSLADIVYMQGKEDDTYLSLAGAAIRLMPENGERRLNQAKADILTARGLIGSGAFDEAESLMSGYTETDDFGLGQNQVYVVCDFKIPFCEIQAKLALHRGDVAAADRYLQMYTDGCDEYHFRAMKLRLLAYMRGAAASVDAALYARYSEMETRVSQKNVWEMTDKYGQFLLTDIDSHMHDVSAAETGRGFAQKYIVQAVPAVVILVFLFCLINIIVSYVNKDGLTRLSNRKQYEKMRVHCERLRIPHCLLMMDVDDFKSVNDRFGHACGDDVLREISRIVRRYSDRNLFSFRYGGEEICMMLLRIPEKRSREIAEEVRKAVEASVSETGMRVTVSIGVGCSETGENAFREADRRLYDAKRAGKNRVC